MNTSSRTGRLLIKVMGAFAAVSLAAITGIVLTVSFASSGSNLPDYTKKDTSKVLGTEENPYTILEIVPDVDSATVGYLINGQEPRNLLSIGATDKSVAYSAAGIYQDAFASEGSPSSFVGDYQDAYTFDQDKGAIGTNPASGFVEKKDEYKSEHESGTDMAYSEFGYYTRVTNGTGNYNYDTGKKCFVPANGGNFSWTSVGAFEHVGTGQIPEGSIPCSRALDYGVDGERSYSYNNATHTGEIGEKAYKYYYSPTGGFKWVPNNNYNNENVFIENQTEMTYVEGEETKTRPITSAQVGDKLYMTRTENVYYVYKASAITVNDLLLKELVSPDATALNYKTQVVTVTPAQLVVDDTNRNEADKAKDLIDTADMIMVHDSSTGYRIARALDGGTGEVPKFRNINSGSKDLTLKTANYIIERGAKGYNTDFLGNVTKPAAVVFDEEAIKSANSYSTASNNCANLKLVYDVYNNLGSKLAYNWMSGQPYTAKINVAKGLPNYRNFGFEEVDALGRSQFVYNYKGTDDSWLTNAFANSSKIVKSELNKPAFSNVNAGATMSVATMLSAINKEANGYNQPRKLRILELQPNEKYYFDANNKDAWVYYYLSLFPWFIGTGKDVTADRDMAPTEENPADITVTTMPTYEFIGRNEDVNETYDMILVGNKEQDETNGGYGQDGKVGYNDALPNQMAYTAVGDLVTTFGGDEMLDWSKEDNDSYKWNYGLLNNNVWSNSNNARPHGSWYRRNIGGLFSPKYVPYYDRGFYRPIIVGSGAFGDNDGFYGLGELFLFNGLNNWWHYNDNSDANIFATKHGSDANMIGLRYSGNDFTKKKYDQLLDFANQGPIIVADDLYNNEMESPDIPNRNKIDESSFVYQLAKKNQDDGAVNKYAHGVTDRINDVKRHLEEDNCSATFTNTMNNQPGLPTEYDADSAINYNTQKDSSGNNVLQYHFVLNGDIDTTYGVNVYTDSNSNGIFEGCINHTKERNANGDNKSFESEKADNLTIFDETIKAFIYDGNLYANHTYLVTKIMPASDVGMIPWKLEIYNKSNDSVRYSKIGYTRIPSNGNKTTITVLQMNLMPDMQDNASTTTVNFADNSDVGRKFKNYTRGLEDFNIQIEFKQNRDWYRTYHDNREQWAKDIMKYDMLVIGFKDVAYFTNDEDFIYGFEKFRAAGKSIILSHDLVQDASIDIGGKNKIDGRYPENYEETKVIQSDVRYYLRDISGQIRKYYDAANYNVTNPSAIDYDYMKYYSYGRRDLTFEPSDNFKIFTSVLERFAIDFWDGNTIWLEVKDYNQTPLIDKYTYTYGNFDDPRLTEYFGYIRHPDHREQAITKPIKVIRDYYSDHGSKPANMIMDNSVRAMLFYNYINYNDSRNTRRSAPFSGFRDRIDRTVKNVDLTNLDSRRQLIWGSNSMLTNRVSAANEGQITKYPFAIPDTIFVADTHAQNYQLDLEYDSDGDVLVWYNLAGTGNRGSGSAVNTNSINVYDSKHQDSRNNYYIYTKGNVTYTGLGHSASNNSPMSDDEIKLFINTMVAAYRSGASDPYITVTNPDAVNNGKTTTIYLEDRGDGGNNIDINYRINDDTTNSKINRQYLLHIYKDGEWQGMIEDAEKAKDYKIENVSYSEVKTNGQVQYQILLVSSYINDQGVEVLVSDVQNVNVVLMPMFGLR